eukprot:CAMPEP_0201915522 /NCGR_PEP_ID=MMETSP0903-20130614/5411_1 /ASSEMBLY_ACC=CAM_ASM_000552 /TAXON_ID=420261 /ORGANISM="Thalassiosira antarctica, Strain CCMP982" /LENGTH=330 /DNA_ID=CAMNT_0048451145 /DNA_START=119 /DNA_END=1111 /DNA_ORIENTATION=+
MPGLTQRRSRRGATFGLKLWKCMLGLGFVLSAPMARSSEHVESSRTNNVHSMNATLSLSTSSNPDSTPSDPAASSSDSEGTSDDYFNISNYCGISWMDAYSNCLKACPSGRDSECSTLGEEYSCQTFTACHERLERGDVTLVVNSSETSTDPPSKQPTLTLTAKPTESPESSSEIVASTEPTQGGSVTTGSVATEASSAARWWLENNGETYTGCVYGEDYPELYLTNEAARGAFLFESEEECCTSYPKVCNPTNSTTSSPLAPTPNQPTNSPSPSTSPSTIAGTSDSEPTAPPTAESTTYTPTYMPYSSAFIHRQSFLFGIATIFMALLF